MCFHTEAELQQAVHSMNIRDKMHNGDDFQFAGIAVRSNRSNEYLGGWYALPHNIKNVQHAIACVYGWHSLNKYTTHPDLTHVNETRKRMGMPQLVWEFGNLTEVKRPTAPDWEKMAGPPPVDPTIERELAPDRYAALMNQQIVDTTLLTERIHRNPRRNPYEMFRQYFAL